ncbi:hypothetical protein SETIT_9G161300v2 [Setaria italica]|uniref:Uncharacterized protein n=1 Tax=Setaria italica TaxID=4555 RepID=A0A368SH83_SETIT|nr:hypothetical protein SETIT_9G161300v2 [Setaria italica]
MAGVHTLFLLVRLELGLLASSTTRQNAFVPPITFGDCGGGDASSEDEFVRYAYSHLEKSGWSLLFRVVLTLFALGSRAVLAALDLDSLGDDMADGHFGLLRCSTIQVRIGVFGAPIDVALKLYVASLEASMSRWEPAPSCKLGMSL